VGSNDVLTTLRNGALSDVLSNVGYVGKAQRFKVQLPAYEFDIAMEGNSATRGSFAYSKAAAASED
jgi:hypothetical protein